eukprot:Phypoly_transcript_16066.p1 GENE.Phypoly_transcript_16066~~Phypoly_transcript_16066.p1  ORF type:complete len:232 (+),score=14.02 Phypoly_transcript_16066:75-770(+)
MSQDNFYSSASDCSITPACGCLLCIRGPPACMSRDRASWVTIVHTTFFALHHKQPEKLCFSLKTSVYPFVIMHWKALGLAEKNTNNWQKLIIDTLSHSPHLFATGAHLVAKSGYWALRDTSATDPWALSTPRNKTRRAAVARYVAAATMQLPASPSSPTRMEATQNSHAHIGPIRNKSHLTNSCSFTTTPLLPPLRLDPIHTMESDACRFQDRRGTSPPFSSISLVLIIFL